MTVSEFNYLRRRLLKKIYIDWGYRNRQVNSGDLNYMELMKQISDKEAFDNAEEPLKWKFSELDTFSKTTYLLYRNLRSYVLKDVTLFISSNDFQRRFPLFLDINDNRRIEKSEWTDFFTSENGEQSTCTCTCMHVCM